MAPSRRAILASMGTSGVALTAGCLHDDDANAGQDDEQEEVPCFVVETVEPAAPPDHHMYANWPEQRARHVEGSTYEIAVLAMQWAYQPSLIEVPADSEGRLFLASTDVEHHFDILRKEFAAVIPAGKIAECTVGFDDYDEQVIFDVACSDPSICTGEGHHTMKGEIHVYPESDRFE